MYFDFLLTELAAIFEGLPHLHGTSQCTHALYYSNCYFIQCAFDLCHNYFVCVSKQWALFQNAVFEYLYS